MNFSRKHEDEIPQSELRDRNILESATITLKGESFTIYTGRKYEIKYKPWNPGLFSPQTATFSGEVYLKVEGVSDKKVFFKNSHYGHEVSFSTERIVGIKEV